LRFTGGGIASLAPDIVEMVIEGNEPNSLSLRRLMKGFPIRWDEQKVELSCEAPAKPHPFSSPNDAHGF
jgi:hypothetical protein